MGIYYKMGLFLLQSGYIFLLLVYYKMGFLLLQNGYLLQNGSFFITKWVLYYKMGSYYKMGLNTRVSMYLSGNYGAACLTCFYELHFSYQLCSNELGI